MQLAITLLAPEGADYAASDLGFLLHKHPGHLHLRETAAGKVSIFFTEQGEARATCVLYLDVDPVALVRGRSPQAEGLLEQYVNDRAYVANSFLSVAMSRALGQSMSGKSKDRQDLADRDLPFELTVTPVASKGGEELAKGLFEPLGYSVEWTPLASSYDTGLATLKISARVRLSTLLTHAYVLIPVLDNAKHYWIGEDEMERLLAKGEGWLAAHPLRDVIVKRSLKYRHVLAQRAIERLTEGVVVEEVEETEAKREAGEAELEAPIRLHDLRLDTVADMLKLKGVTSVLDLGCGEGKLIRRLIPERNLKRIVGVDPSVRVLEVAARRLHLDEAGAAKRERVQLQMGSLTYGDRRWQGFDAATLVEVIEHIEPSRLSSLELSLFGDARPGLVIVTTPNVEYNALFEGMAPGTMRHADHRFEWTRAEFADWAARVCAAHRYTVEIWPLGPVDEQLGGPSQMAVFERGGKAAEVAA